MVCKFHIGQKDLLKMISAILSDLELRKFHDSLNICFFFYVSSLVWMQICLDKDESKV